LIEKEPFLTALQNRILLFDGAMGTEIQKHNPSPEDFPNNQDGFNDGLILTHPDWIKQIHRNYLNAGSDCIETNSFGSNKIKLDEYGNFIQEKSYWLAVKSHYKGDFPNDLVGLHNFKGGYCGVSKVENNAISISNHGRFEKTVSLLQPQSTF
jgi:hypothetical protein